MNKEHQEIWIKLRAEVIKHFHDTENADKFKGGFSIFVATKIAEAELENSLKDKFFVLTIEEMLLLSLDECVELVHERLLNKFKELLLL